MKDSREDADTDPHSHAANDAMSVWAVGARLRASCGPFDRPAAARGRETSRRLRVAVVIAVAVLGAATYHAFVGGGRSAVPAPGARAQRTAARLRAPLADRGPTAARRTAVALARLDALPLQAQSLISTSLGSDASMFAAQRSNAGYRLRGGGVSAHLAARDVALRAGGATLSLGSFSIGRGARVERPGVASITAHGNRVIYRRGSVTAWYAAGPLGIEQGFTIGRRPVGAGSEFTVAIGLGGDLRARRSGANVAFLTRSGDVALRYGGLSATDARGRRLPATLSVRDGRLLLGVADADATYPVRIDPLIQVGSKITPADEVEGTYGSWFGASVALSSDGTTALVGGPQDDTRVGAAWVYTNSGGFWSEQQKLVAPTSGGDAETGTAWFGTSVALSADGTTALIGGLYDNSVGAAWVYTRSGSLWSERAKLTGMSEIGNSAFGQSVALSGDGTTALIGGDTDNSSVGAAWVFTGSGSSWVDQVKLIAPTSGGDEEVGDALFGWSVALSSAGTTALISGYEDNTAVGAAWVYTGSGNSWAEQAKLTAPTSGPQGEVGAAWFGWSVALSGAGTTALVGGPFDSSDVGAAWVFTGSGSSWIEQAKLTAPTTGPDAESGAGNLGSGVSLSSPGNVALVGGSADAGDLGASWVFTKSGSSWSEGAELVADTSGASAEIGAGFFGGSVALSADATTSLITGEADDTCGGGCYAGAAWVSTPPDGFAFGPDPITFGSTSAAVDTGTSHTDQVTVTNDGYLPRVLGSVTVSGAQAASFSLSSDGCSGQTLAPGSSCSLSVTFAPAAVGAFAAQVNVPDNAPNSPDVVSLSGFAVLTPPVLLQSADVAPVAGTVLVEPAGTASFAALTTAQNIPMGSTIDATNGTVEITTALPDGTTQTGEFYDGRFVLTQGADGRVTAKLTGGSFAGCPRPRKGRKGPVVLAAAAKTAKTVVRKLWGNAHGSYTTSGRSGAATVLGTVWLTEDRCDGTYFKVTKDTISVTAFAHPRKKHVLKQGHSILVLAPGFSAPRRR